VLLALAAATAGWLTLQWVLIGVPARADLRAIEQRQPSVVLWNTGAPLYTFNDRVHRRVPLEQVSPHVVHALIDTEDRRFYDHRGIDPLRVVSAAWHTVLGDVQGGSTLTQQLARNLFPVEIGRERSMERKLREMATAWRIEQVYSKDEILAQYLNTAPFLYGVSGIEMAARTYFGVPARALDPAQAATLVAMLKGTDAYNPHRNPERALARRNLVLRLMDDAGHLPAPSLQVWQSRPLALNFRRLDQEPVAALHFVAQVRREVEAWADREGRDLVADGLRIETGLDPGLQASAEAAVARQTALLQQVAAAEWSSARLYGVKLQADGTLRGRTVQAGQADTVPFPALWSERPDVLADVVLGSQAHRDAVAAGRDPNEALRDLSRRPRDVLPELRAATRLEAGLVAIDPINGEVRAWVGSRDFQKDQYDHVALARRQPGSTFKPFVYGAALEAGFRPDRAYLDAPMSVNLPGGRVWRPTDMGGSSGAMLTMSDGLIRSRNTVTAQVMQDVGVDHVVQFAKAAGLRQSRLDPVPSLALGTSPVSLLEMTSAYATIAAQGEYHAPTLVRRITDSQGRVLADFTPEGQRAMSRRVSEQLLGMLRGVVDTGTGRGLRSEFGVGSDVAGKTGTTQNNADGWFMLMQPRLVTGAWVGFNDQRITLRGAYWGQGAHNALRVAGDFYASASRQGQVDVALQFPRLPQAQDLGLESDELLGATLPGDVPAPPGYGEPPVQAPGIVAQREADDGTDIYVVRQADGSTLITDKSGLFDAGVPPGGAGVTVGRGLVVATSGAAAVGQPAVSAAPGDDALVAEPTAPSTLRRAVVPLPLVQPR